MRRLLYLVIGFASGCALCAYLLPRSILTMLAAIAAGCAGILGVFGRGRGFLKRLAIILLGGCLSCLWFGQYYRLYLNDAVAADGTKQTVTVSASDYSYETSYASAVDGTVELNGKTYQARVYLKEKINLEPGAVLDGEFRFRVTTPEGKEPATYHQGRGIFLLLYQTGEIEVTQREQLRWTEWIAVLQRRIMLALENAFPEDTAPFAKALLLGDTRDLSYAIDSDFKISGIRHVVAVSGLHVSILFALLSTITFHNRFLSALAGFPILLLFAALAGFTPSVCRSCLMLGLTLLASLTQREYDGPTALAFSVLVMLIANPLIITDAGFQLSVGSVAGIYLFAEKIRLWILGFFGDLKGRTARSVLARGLASSISITLSATGVTTPLCAVCFGTVSLVGVGTNLLTLWIISFIFYGILAVCLLAIVWEAGAAALAWVVSWPIRYVLHVAERMAAIPLAAVYTKSVYIVLWLILLYLLLLVFLLGKRYKPRELICCAVIGLCAALLLSWSDPMHSNVSLTVLDVGQGQCLLVQSGSSTFLVDCGGDRDGETADTAAAALLSRGIFHLDGLILTHMDRDHAGAAENLLHQVDTELLILPPEASHLPEHTEGQVVYATEDILLTAGNTKIQIFVPTFPGKGNENSLCVLFDTEKCDILITGDRDGFGERSLLRNGSIPEVDVLIAGHHGSRHSTCEELLEAVKPEIVCISAGADNPYGHPAPELLARLEQFGCVVYRTDIHGDIIIRR